MWRTVIITQGERVRLQNNWVVVQNGEKEQQIPISDLYSIIVDNRAAHLTVGAITALTNEGVHIIFCDEKHSPVSVVTSLNTHYRPLNVIRKQLALSDNFKDALWQKVIMGKIENQAQVLKMQGGCSKTYQHLIKFVLEVLPGDKTNREGLAAKMYFRELYGGDFIRMQDNIINAAMNYGYAIIRSCVAKTLCAYGYNCVLGIHHISETNAFNLADDLMEPLRPIVDLWVDKNNENLVSELGYSNRKGLIDIINTVVELDGKNTKVRYAIDRYISSLTTAIDKQDEKLLKLPKIINKTLVCGEFGDD